MTAAARVLSLLAISVWAGCAARPTPTAAVPLPDRWQFAAAMAQLAEGDRYERVLELLGPPDDIVDARSRGDDGRGVVQWCYGTDGHGTLPTLGQVHIDARGVVVERNGAEPCRLPRGLLTEHRLRQLLRCAMRTTPRWPEADPRGVLALANAWIDVGEQAAVASFVELHRIVSWHEDAALRGALLAARVAFALPPGGTLPDAELGAPDVQPAVDRRRTPRFPMHVVHDHVFELCSAYRIGGEVDYLWQMHELARVADLRAEPLEPGAPGAALERLFAQLRAIDTDESRTDRDALLGGGARHGFAVTAWRTAGADDALLGHVERHLAGRPVAAAHRSAVERMLAGLSPHNRDALAAMIRADEPWRDREAGDHREARD